MKAIHKATVLDAVQFDPNSVVWPKGVVQVTTSTPHRSTFEYVLRQPQLKDRTLRSGDYVVATLPSYSVPEKDSEDTFAQEPEPYYDVVSRETFETEYIVLGEVETP